MKIQVEVEAFILSFLISELRVYRDEWSASQTGHFIPGEMVPITIEYPVTASTNLHMSAKISIHKGDSYMFQSTDYRQGYSYTGSSVGPSARRDASEETGTAVHLNTIHREPLTDYVIPGARKN